MGLLTSASTDVSSGGPLKVLKKLKNYSTVICILLYLIGICYFGIVNWPSFHGKTYFSENALLPGLVDEEFKKSKVLSAYSREVKKAMMTSEKYFMPVEWLQQKFSDIGLESYVQNFTVNLPFAEIKNMAGRNVFGILRAPRGFSESLLITVPYRMNSYSTLGLLFSLAEFCREQIYWAKDLIFVIVEHESIGMEAWLSAYHHRHMEAIRTDSLVSRGGAIQAAVAVELSKPFGPFTHADIKFSMVNGQLPNLDLINLVVRMTEKEALEPTLFKQEDTWNPFTWEGYSQLLKTSLRGLLSQAAGRPSGLHATFGSYGIECVTLEVYQKGRKVAAEDYHIGLDEIARILEGTLRSLNNLLERFHQSFFFYVLPSAHRYISIGSYMPGVGFMILAPLLKQSHSLRTIGPVIVLAHVVGMLLYSVPFLLLHYQRSDSLLVNGLIGIKLAVLSFPYVLKKRLRENRNSVKPSSPLLHSVLLILLALMVGVTSVLNFGLGFFLAIISIPACLVAQSEVNRVHYWVANLLLILINPLVLAMIMNMTLVYTGSPVWLGWRLWLLKTCQMTKMNIISVIVDCFVHGSWMFALISLFFVPLWTLFWTVVNL